MSERDREAAALLWIMVYTCMYSQLKSLYSIRHVVLALNLEKRNTEYPFLSADDEDEDEVSTGSDASDTEGVSGSSWLRCVLQ